MTQPVDPQRDKRRLTPIGVALLYAVFAALWITVSGALLNMSVDDPVLQGRIEIAKGLLFLCVGVIEHKIHSRNIDDMVGLILKMPRVSVMLQIGMAGMFLAPFGMLISKYAVLKAVLDSCPLLSIFIVFGSAATLHNPAKDQP